MVNSADARAVAAPVPCAFHEGDAVYLALGSYQGTLGTFLHLKDDPKWADILEPNSKVRSHPVEWMALVSSKKQ